MLPLRKYHLLLFNYMTMRQRTINNLIEISPQAEGSFLTQAFPTNFHQFYTKKLLTPQESVSDYKEVTAAEKANIINADSQWVEPSEELKATATSAGATYNNSTHYFELNGLTDITAEQMRNILEWGTYERFINVCDCHVATAVNNIPQLRTTIPSVSFVSWRSKSYPPLTWMPQGLEIIKLSVSGSVNPIFNLDNDLTLYDAPTLRCILDTLRPTLRIRIGSPNYPTALSTLYIKDLQFSIDLANLPALSLASLQYLVTNSANTDAITVTVHPDVYAKLTGDTSNAAASALTEAELAQWQALVAQAAEKQITFATTS